MAKQRELTYTVSNSHARHKLYRGLHLLWRLCRSQAIAADMLGCSRQAFIHACKELPTDITLAQVKRAARAYALDVKDDFEPYEFAAVQAIVSLIDPAADIAYTSGSSVEHFSAKMLEHLNANWMKPLAVGVHYFKARGFKPKYLRQVIKRLVARDPLVAMRVVDEDDSTPPDPINRFQVIVTEEQLVEAKKEPRRTLTDRAYDGKREATSLKVEAKARIRRKPTQTPQGEQLPDNSNDNTIPPPKKKDPAPAKAAAKKKPATRKAPVTQQLEEIKSQDAIIQETAESLREKVTEIMKPAAVEMTVFEKIAAARDAGIGPSKNVEDRLAKLLKQGGQ